MHTLIIGGGLAGPLCGIGMVGLGGTATVYEAHGEDGGTTVGTWLTVAVNGLAAMAALGVHAEALACGFASRTIELVSDTGKSLAMLPIGGELPDGTVTQTLARTALYGRLTAAARARGVEFAYHRRLVDARPDDGGVIAIFDDGSHARGDRLIGADGVHSCVRRVIDPAAVTPRYTGLLNLGGFTPAGRIDVAPGTYRMVFGRRLFFGYTVAPDGEVWWFANVPQRRELPRTELNACGSEGWKRRLVELLADDVGPMAEIVRACPSPLVATHQYELPSVSRWHRDAMVLVGDAAHAASPSSGQGVSMAAEDAAVLTHCLSQHGALAPALEHFEATRRPRVEQVVAYGARMSSSKTVGPVGRMLRDALLPWFMRRTARQLEGGALSWLYDERFPTLPFADTAA